MYNVLCNGAQISLIISAVALRCKFHCWNTVFFCLLHRKGTGWDRQRDWRVQTAFNGGPCKPALHWCCYPWDPEDWKHSSSWRAACHQQRCRAGGLHSPKGHCSNQFSVKDKHGLCHISFCVFYLPLFQLPGSYSNSQFDICAVWQERVGDASHLQSKSLSEWGVQVCETSSFSAFLSW